MNELYKIHAERCKVFSNSTRLELLNSLKDKELSVTKLIEKTKLNQANKNEQDSLTILKRRYASGEITKKQYEEMKKELKR